MLASEVGEIEACRRTERLLHRIPPPADLHEVIPDLGWIQASNQAGDLHLVQVEHASSYLDTYRLDAHRGMSCVRARRHISTIPTTVEGVKRPSDLSVAACGVKRSVVMRAVLLLPGSYAIRRNPPAP